MKKLLILVVVLCFTVIAAGCGSSSNSGNAPAAPPAAEGKSGTEEKTSESVSLDSVTIGTASAGSSANATGVAFAKIISEELDISAQARVVGGSDAIVQNLMENRVDIGFFSPIALESVYKAGKGPEDQDIAILLTAQRAEPRQLVARAESGIETPEDLVGKTVIAKRAALKDLEQFMDAMIEAYDLDKSQINIVETSDTNEATRALRQGTADAAILPGDLRSGPITELSQNTDLTFVGLPDDKLQEILKAMGPVYTTASIPADIYKGQTEEVQTIGQFPVLGAVGSLPDDAAYHIVKAILEHPDLETLVINGKDYIVKNNVPDDIAGVPFHPGALKYYEEKGLR